MPLSHARGLTLIPFPGAGRDDGLILADATAGALTVTLPSAANRKGHEVVVKRMNSGTNAVTVTAASGETIDGAATRALATQYDSLTLVSDGTNWVIV